MPDELIPIVLFVGLFSYLSVRALASMFENMSRTKSNLKFMQGLVDRGFSASEIERIMQACHKHSGYFDQCNDLTNGLNPRMTHPVPPVKQSVQA